MRDFLVDLAVYLFCMLLTSALVMWFVSDVPMLTTLDYGDWTSIINSVFVTAVMGKIILSRMKT